MKFFNILLLAVVCSLGFSSCSMSVPYLWKGKESSQQKEQGDLSAPVKKGPDSACKKALDRAINAFNKDIPILGADLTDIMDSLSLYQTCEEVKRDDRIAEVLLKLLQRVSKLEAEVEELKSMSIAPNP